MTAEPNDAGSTANTDKQRRREQIEKALIRHRCTAGLAAWLASIDIMLADVIERERELRSLLEEFGIVTGGIPVNLHELHDIAHRLNGTLAESDDAD